MPVSPFTSPVPVAATDAALPFLTQAARDLLTRYPGSELSDLVLVVPTRRAVVYLKNELALAADLGSALWSPRVAAMEDYMVELAGVQVEEPIALQLMLFDILRDIDRKLDFDQFVGWSGLLIQDFSNLDQNLATPSKVFEYLTQAKALERWQLADAPASSSTTVAYFRFWDDLEKVYWRLRKRMEQDRLAYPGLAYRLAVNRVQNLIENDAPLARHVFLGLGSLSRAEERLIRLLLKQNLAEVRFDGDGFYMDNDSPNRAGQHLRRYRKQWELPNESFGGPADLLRTLTRQVQFVGVANASMQGKVAGQLLAESRTLDPTARVAIVLPDETLLLPVLHGLPPEAVPAYNVTMGLSFQSTPLFNLVDLLFEVHLTGVREGSPETGYGVPRYHHLAVSKLLQHPFLRRYQQWLDKQPDPTYHGLLEQVCNEIVRRNAVLLPAQELLVIGRQHPLVKALFATWDTCDDIIAACYTLIDLLKQAYADQHSAIEAEYLYLFFTLVKRLDSVFDCREQRLSVRSFRRFLYEQMARTRLPFSGEPIADVQVMGLLETRALDFDHVIILSCNERVLPAPKNNTSLFPYDVLTQFNMPTYADHEAATAHQFWRLLQRARRVDLLHVLPGAEGTRTGERSRFLLQIENDLQPQNPNLTLRDLTASVEDEDGTSLPKREYGGDLVLEKDPEMLAALRAVLERGLSPSALNQFLNCSLQFYFARIAKFQEADEVEEKLGADSFGTVVHETLENLLRPFVKAQQAVAAPDIPALLKAIPAELEKAMRHEQDDKHARPDEGLNHVLSQVAAQLVRRYLEGLADTPGALPLRVVALEEILEARVPVTLPAGDTLNLLVFGYSDRLDELPDGRIRVVDYKTGLVQPYDLKLQKRGDDAAAATQRLLADATSSADKVRQLWLYRFMLERAGRPAADAAIISLRNLSAGPMTAEMGFLTEDGTTFVTKGEELLAQLTRRMLDPAEPIRKTDDLDRCQYCPYRGICAR
ncbi:PD-(D/E)XK nuclease family protein [Hymenobacter sp. BT175]|uniref:PD-(D/E)XK nuclease family protein n=1 Tax=Hymenobacter translucens TaxID=2886507 RepID=UPI001D0E0EAC|nr:PD-(D/E)XK nuclease family protein [Hymenobacter translucens]MCC2546344.1 PD-(D/E)XK nuclease family protein [Hymenobacter translucens]